MLNAKDYNVIIQVEKPETQDIKEFHAHSNTLRVRSQYFKNAFLNESITNMPNITSTVFMILK